MARMHRIVRVRFEHSGSARKDKGNITHVECEGPNPQDEYEGIMALDEVIGRMGDGEQFFVLRTLWSRVHDHGGHIQADPDRCGSTNLKGLPEIPAEFLAAAG